MAEIIEVAPRDGLQNDPVHVSTADKLALIGKAVDAGIRFVEAVSFAHPRHVPQMADAEAVLAGLPRDGRARFEGLVLNAKGFERARASGCREINFVLVATDAFAGRNQRTDVNGLVAQWIEVSRAAREAGIKTTAGIGASFGCPFEGEVPASKVLRIVEAIMEAPPDQLSFADTIGCGVPRQARALIEGAQRIAPGMPLRIHLHNTRNTGIANAAAALEAGINAIDASIGGTGGCPFAPKATGNIATEDLVYFMERSGLHTGIDLDAVIRAAEWLSGILRRPLPGAVSAAGGFPRAAA